MSHTPMACLHVVLTDLGDAQVALHGIIRAEHVAGVVGELDSLIRRLNDPSDLFDEVVESHYLSATDGSLVSSVSPNNLLLRGFNS